MCCKLYSWVHVTHLRQKIKVAYVVKIKTKNVCSGVQININTCRVQLYNYNRIHFELRKNLSQKVREKKYFMP